MAGELVLEDVSIAFLSVFTVRSKGWIGRRADDARRPVVAARELKWRIAGPCATSLLVPLRGDAQPRAAGAEQPAHVVDEGLHTLLRDEIDTVERFLHGSASPGSAWAVDRYLVRGDAAFEASAFELRTPYVQDGRALVRLMVTFNPHFRVAGLTIDLRFERIPVDDLIALTQSARATAASSAGADTAEWHESAGVEPESARSAGAPESVRRVGVLPAAARMTTPVRVRYERGPWGTLGVTAATIRTSLLARLSLQSPGRPVNYHCIEVRRIPETLDARAAAGTYAREWYGLLAADEGFRMVPEALARKRIRGLWRTREFFGVACFDHAVLSINLKSSTDYVRRQAAWTTKYHGRYEPYFEADSCIAGLDHGVYTALERCATRELVVRRLMDRGRTARRPILLPGSLGRLRKALVAELNEIGAAHILEIDRLERQITRALRLPEKIAGIKEELDELDTDARLVHEARMAVLMTVLTAAAVLVGLTRVDLATLPWLSAWGWRLVISAALGAPIAYIVWLGRR